MDDFLSDLRTRFVHVRAAVLLLACAVPRILLAQGATSSRLACDSILQAARVDSVSVTARAYLVRRDGRMLPARAREFLIAAILDHFRPPKPFQLPVFSPGPAPMRMLRPENLDHDSVSSREPILYGVYDFSLLRSGLVTGLETSVPTMVPGFDSSVVAAINGAVGDSTLASIPRGLDLGRLDLELRISTGPEDTRFRVPPATVFTAMFPRLRLVDVKASPANPPADYPEDERDDGRDGEVVLRVVIAPNGSAIIPTMEVLHATSSAFALAAARALARYRFTPAHVNGCSVPQVIEIPFWFSLRP